MVDRFALVLSTWGFNFHTPLPQQPGSSTPLILELP